MTRVPCNGCRVCCQDFDLIVLHPESGDDPSKYKKNRLLRHPLNGEMVFALQHKANGDCAYLGDDGCTIYEDRPAVCRKYDCRKAYLKLQSYGSEAVASFVRKGYVTEKKLAAGRERLYTLPPGRRKAGAT